MLPPIVISNHGTHFPKLCKYNSLWRTRKGRAQSRRASSPPHVDRHDNTSSKQPPITPPLLWSADAAIRVDPTFANAAQGKPIFTITLAAIPLRRAHQSLSHDVNTPLSVRDKPGPLRGGATPPLNCAPAATPAIKAKGWTQLLAAQQVAHRTRCSLNGRVRSEGLRDRCTESGFANCRETPSRWARCENQARVFAR